MNSRKSNFDCSNKDVLVAYLYDEMPERERAFFEGHLVDCQSCIDEFAALSNARYSVYEWQKLEFAPMETPVFEIPRLENAGLMAATRFVDRVRAFFAFKPGFMVAGSFAALAFAVLLSYVVFVGFDAAEGLVASDQRATIEPPVMEKPLASHSPAPAARPDDNVVVSELPEVEDSIDKTVKPSYTVAPEKRPTSAHRPAKTRRRTVEPVDQTAISSRTSYRLNDFDDPSDDSLRLADLLDEV